MLEEDANAALHREFPPVDAGDPAMRIYLRLLAEQAADAIDAHELARVASDVERMRRVGKAG